MTTEGRKSLLGGVTMAKKLLNVTFSSGFTTFNLGANSADNITGQGVWPDQIYDKKESLNQVGW